MNTQDLPMSRREPRSLTALHAAAELASQGRERCEEIASNESILGSRAPASQQTEDAWREIHRTAMKVAVHEPLLMRRLQHLVLERTSLADMLAAILADRLASRDLPEADLYCMMSGIFNSDPQLMAQATADLLAVTERDPACPDHLHVLLNLKGFQALQTHRVSHRLWQQGRSELAFTLANFGSLVFGVDIHPAARIGRGVMLDHGAGIVIGETAVVEDDVSILQNVTLGGTGKERGDRHPKIRRGVMIGAGAKILGNIEIGSMSKVAAGSVVLRHVPPHCTVAGVPARVVRRHLGNDAPALEMQQTI